MTLEALRLTGETISLKFFNQLTDVLLAGCVPSHFDRLVAE